MSSEDRAERVWTTGSYPDFEAVEPFSDDAPDAVEMEYMLTTATVD